MLLPLLMWELIGRVGVFGEVWPPLTAVIDAGLGEPGRRILTRAVAATLPGASSGLAVGIIAGIACGLAGAIVPFLRDPLLKLAVFAQAVPAVVIAPLLVTTIDRYLIPSILAMMAAFFASCVSLTAGLASYSSIHDDLFRTLGAGRLRRMRHLEIPSALPYLLAGIRFALPGAIVGAIVGEWFGASRGLGVVMLHMMRTGNLEMLLAATCIVSILTLAPYAVLGLLARRTSTQTP